MQHLQELIARIPALQSCAVDVQRAFDLLHRTYQSGGKLLLCGNGGSSADAEHWSGELLKQFVMPRPLGPQARGRLPQALADKLQWGLAAIPLSGFHSLQSAFGNDADPLYCYAQLTWVLGNPGDTLVALSTSGNSSNVCLAAETAKARGMTVLALTGKSGGRLLNLADVCVRAPATRVHEVQEYHLPIYHCLSLMLEQAFAGSAGVGELDGVAEAAARGTAP